MNKLQDIFEQLLYFLLPSRFGDNYKYRIACYLSMGAPPSFVGGCHSRSTKSLSQSVTFGLLILDGLSEETPFGDI